MDEYIENLEKEVGLIKCHEIMQFLLNDEPELWFNPNLEGFTDSGLEYYTQLLEEANNYDPSGEPEFVEEK